MDEWEKIEFPAKLSWMQQFSCVKGIEYIKSNGENSGALYLYYRFFSQSLGIFHL